jgi:hypothetical protein
VDHQAGNVAWSSEECVTITSCVKDAKCVNKYGILVIAVYANGRCKNPLRMRCNTLGYIKYNELCV